MNTALFGLASSPRMLWEPALALWQEATAFAPGRLDITALPGPRAPSYGPDAQAAGELPKICARAWAALPTDERPRGASGIDPEDPAVVVSDGPIFRSTFLRQRGTTWIFDSMAMSGTAGAGVLRRFHWPVSLTDFELDVSVVEIL